MVVPLSQPQISKPRVLFICGPRVLVHISPQTRFFGPGVAILRSYFMNSFGSHAKNIPNFGIQQYNKWTTKLGASNSISSHVRSSLAEVSMVHVRSPRSGGVFHAGRHPGPALHFRTAGLQFRCRARLQYDERRLPWPLLGYVPPYVHPLPSFALRVGNDLQ